jgi:hypothetical protein
MPIATTIGIGIGIEIEIDLAYAAERSPIVFELDFR